MDRYGNCKGAQLPDSLVLYLASAISHYESLEGHLEIAGRQKVRLVHFVCLNLGVEKSTGGTMAA